MPQWVLGQGGWVPAMSQKSQLQQEAFSWLVCWEQTEGAYSHTEMIPHKEMIPKGLPLAWSQQLDVYNSSIP